MQIPLITPFSIPAVFKSSQQHQQKFGTYDVIINKPDNDKREHYQWYGRVVKILQCYKSDNMKGNLGIDYDFFVDSYKHRGHLLRPNQARIRVIEKGNAHSPPNADERYVMNPPSLWCLPQFCAYKKVNGRSNEQ